MSEAEKEDEHGPNLKGNSTKIPQKARPFLKWKDFMFL